MPPERKPRKAYQHLKGYTKAELILFREWPCGADTLVRRLWSWCRGCRSCYGRLVVV